MRELTWEYNGSIADQNITEDLDVSIINFKGRGEIFFRYIQYCTWVPIEPVDPTIEIGFGPSQTLCPGSGTARPGQAGGGGCAEQQTLPPTVVPFSFLFKANPPENPKVRRPKFQVPPPKIGQNAIFKQIDAANNKTACDHKSPK